MPDPDGITTCPGCGSRLMTRSAALRSHGGANPAPPTVPALPPAPPPPVVTVRADAARTIPPASASLGPRPAAAPAAAPPAGSDTTRRRKAEGKKSDVEIALDLVLQEVRALRETQDHILHAIADLRRGSRAAAGERDLEGPEPPERAFSPIRDGRRKNVMLVDDDPSTRAAVIEEFRKAEVPVRSFDDGSAALSAIAEEKPDVIALELGLGGAMGGKDLVNMIKATMEWVDIPIVLWTREAVSTQKEARQIHGCDEVVPKAGGSAALLACVINVFRR
jgi:CheY-like chemotaxis protein